MATTDAAVFTVARSTSMGQNSSAGALFCAALTPLALAIHGYHPYVEDGGLYLAGVKRLLNPRLYPAWNGFVTTHLKFSLFAPMMAAAVRLSHVSLMAMMLAVYVGGIWFTLFCGWLLTSRCTNSPRQCAGAVTVLALTLTIPVAGTSLMLMDPYLTARSLSTPLGILMLVGAMDALGAWTERSEVAWRAIALCTASFAGAAVMHPLMAGYSLCLVLVLVCVWAPEPALRMASAGALCAVAVVAAACLERVGPANTAAYAEVARTRTYWFLSRWQWYELLGLLGPVAVLLPMSAARQLSPSTRRLAFATILSALTSIVVALLFARVHARSYEVARLQPLRMYQTVYLLMLLGLGAFLADRLLKRSALRWTLLIAGVGLGMAAAQRSTFPASGHIEWPGRPPDNAWKQAFEWVRSHTPQDAVFALDANYIRAEGEDSQNFRAIAERSALPDEAKDGGVASIAPGLTQEWLAGKSAQTGLDRGVGMADAARLRRLLASWIVVQRQTPTAFPCNFINQAVKVCELPAAAR
ncbi:MAG TPA: hypothetical protein VHA37_02395 [Candidatus Saccharimonadales bacterium]|nr:hypothetical protein [Candidatus Saccharimonadales bacterium]